MTLNELYDIKTLLELGKEKLPSSYPFDKLYNETIRTVDKEINLKKTNYTTGKEYIFGDTGE